MTTSEANFPEESETPRHNYFSALNVPQDEIDIRFGWIAETERFDRIEREVLGESRNDQFRRISGIVIRKLFEVVPSFTRLL